MNWFIEHNKGFASKWTAMLLDVNYTHAQYQCEKRQRFQGELVIKPKIALCA